MWCIGGMWEWFVKHFEAKFQILLIIFFHVVIFSESKATKSTNEMFCVASHTTKKNRSPNIHTAFEILSFWIYCILCKILTWNQQP